MMQEVAPRVFHYHPSGGGEVYLLRTHEGVVLVDSGPSGVKTALLEAMQQVRIDPAEIRLAFATHLHCDHIGELGWWRQAYGFPVIAHANDADAIESGDPVKTAADMPYTTHHTTFIPCPVARRVMGGETVMAGGREFSIIHMPGHTPGSIFIHSGDELFTGDVLFENGGVGWIDVHWGSNPDDYLETLQAMRRYIGMRVYPGHGMPYTLKTEQIDTACKTVEFYLPHEHGYGTPRANRGKESNWRLKSWQYQPRYRYHASNCIGRNRWSII